MKRTTLFILALAFLAGCRRREIITVNGNKISVEKNGKTVTITGNNGDTSYMAGPGATLPANFPKDVPVYPGAAIVSSVSGSEASGSGQMVTMETPDAPEKVVAFYKDKLSGWKNSMEMSTGSGKMLVLVSSDEKRTVSITANPSGGKTAVSLTAAQKP